MGGRIVYCYRDECRVAKAENSLANTKLRTGNYNLY